MQTTKMTSVDRFVLGLGIFVALFASVFIVGEATGKLPATTIFPSQLPEPTAKTDPDLWQAPNFAHVGMDEQGLLIRYGRELVKRTSEFLGPNGSVGKQTNGMNCQNCHLDAGTRPFGNNYSAVFTTYPKFRERSGTDENIEKRITDCFERSLNGRAPNPESREMKAMIAYINWVGSEVPKGTKPKGVGLMELPFLKRAADPKKGEALYATQCASCHGANGEGIKNPDGKNYLYPPLWGENSYNHGAGLYRLSRFAGYIKANMPFEQATYDKPVLTDEEAWDLAAFVNSQPRPTKDLSKDWPNIAGKPVDHPFAPFVDSLPEAQHKYGPYDPIKKALAAYKKSNAAK